MYLCVCMCVHVWACVGMCVFGTFYTLLTVRVCKLYRIHLINFHFSLKWKWLFQVHSVHPAAHSFRQLTLSSTDSHLVLPFWSTLLANFIVRCTRQTICCCSRICCLSSMSLCLAGSTIKQHKMDPSFFSTLRPPQSTLSSLFNECTLAHFPHR